MAAACFETAQKLNPDNFVAQVNLQFNQDLRAGRTNQVDLAATTTDRFGKYSNWMELTDANGPFDDPSFCFESGLIFIQNTFQRQAIAAFARVIELVPDCLPARLLLAQLYLVNRLPDRSLAALQAPLERPENFGLGPTNSTQLNILAAGAYLQKNDLAQGTRLIELEISRRPDDSALLEAAAKAFMLHGLYTNALAVMDRQLRATPDDPAWLYGKGLASIQIKAYDDAIAAFTRVLEMQTNNYDALFNRAVARLQRENFAAARADYLQLQQVYYQFLSNRLWPRRNRLAPARQCNEAVRNYQIYLANAQHQFRRG